MKEINLTQGKVALVDDEDYEKVSQFKWFAIRQRHHWYAGRSIPDKTKKSGQRTVLLHQFLLPGGRRVDHRDGNGLNNLCGNLRAATGEQNGANCKRSLANSSGFKGVSWNPVAKRWRADIRPQRRHIFLGHFETPESAAKAYDTAAVENFGAFARLNFEC